MITINSFSDFDNPFQLPIGRSESADSQAETSEFAAFLAAISPAAQQQISFDQTAVEQPAPTVSDAPRDIAFDLSNEKSDEKSETPEVCASNIFAPVAGKPDAKELPLDKTPSIKPDQALPVKEESFLPVEEKRILTVKEENVLPYDAAPPVRNPPPSKHNLPFINPPVFSKPKFQFSSLQPSTPQPPTKQDFQIAVPPPSKSNFQIAVPPHVSKNNFQIIAAPKPAPFTESDSLPANNDFDIFGAVRPDSEKGGEIDSFKTIKTAGTNEIETNETETIELEKQQAAVVERQPEVFSQEISSNVISAPEIFAASVNKNQFEASRRNDEKFEIKLLETNFAASRRIDEKFEVKSVETKNETSVKTNSTDVRQIVSINSAPFESQPKAQTAANFQAIYENIVSALKSAVSAQSQSETENAAAENGFVDASTFRFEKASENSTTIIAAQDVSVEIEKATEQTLRPLLALAKEAINTEEPRVVRLRLNPEELGTVEIRLENTGSGNLRAHLTTETEAARQALSQNLNQLQAALESAGWKIENLNVTVDSSANAASSGGGQQHFSQQQPRDEQRNSANSQSTATNDASAADVRPEKLLSVLA